MAVALILDFPGGTREQYEEVVRRMELGGQMAAGGLAHVAGRYEGGWRVIDTWTSREARDRFIEERVMPAMQAARARAPAVP